MAPSENALSVSTNVNQIERGLSALAGGALLFASTRVGKLAAFVAGGSGAVLLYRAVTGRCPGYASLGVSTAGDDAATSSIEVDESITVYGKLPDELYDFWRDVSNLPQFMRHIRAVEQKQEGRSSWTAEIPKGLGTIEWDAEVTEEVPGKRIAWRSLPGADVASTGSVEFEKATGIEGTKVRVQMSYRPPGGELGTLLGHLLNPANEQMIREDVRRFKQLMETGEVPQIEGQPTGKGRA